METQLLTSLTKQRNMSCNKQIMMVQSGLLKGMGKAFCSTDEEEEILLKRHDLLEKVCNN